MPRPQQRPARNRRTTSPNAPRLTGDIAWTPQSSSNTETVFALSNFTGKLVLGAPPPFVASVSGAVPTGATLAGSLLTVSWDVVLRPNDQITLPAESDGLRTSTGGFLLGQTRPVTGYAPPALQLHDVGETLDSGTNVLAALGVAGVVLLPAVAGFGATYTMVPADPLAGEWEARTVGGASVARVTAPGAVNMTFDGAGWIVAQVP